MEKVDGYEGMEKWKSRRAVIAQSLFDCCLYANLYRHLSTAIRNSLMGPEAPVLISLSTSLPKSLPLCSTCHPSGPQSQSAHARYRIEAPSGRLGIVRVDASPVVLLSTPLVNPMFSKVRGDVTSQQSRCSVSSADAVFLLLLLLLEARGNSSFCECVGFAEGWSSYGAKISVSLLQELSSQSSLTASPLRCMSCALPFLSKRHLHPPSGQYRSVALFPASSISFSRSNSTLYGVPGLRDEVDATDMLAGYSMDGQLGFKKKRKPVALVKYNLSRSS